MTNTSHETQIMQKAINELLARGFVLSVNDGEEITVKRSRDAQEIFNAMRTTDEDYLLVHDSEHVPETQRWIRFVYGNDGWDVINDYSASLEQHLPETNALIDALAETSAELNG